MPLAYPKYTIVLGGRATMKEIAASFEKVYGIKPTLESHGSLNDLYKLMHEKREKEPANVYGYMSLYVLLIRHYPEKC